MRGALLFGSLFGLGVSLALVGGAKAQNINLDMPIPPPVTVLPASPPLDAALYDQLVRAGSVLPILKTCPELYLAGDTLVGTTKDGVALKNLNSDSIIFAIDRNAGVAGTSRVVSLSPSDAATPVLEVRTSNDVLVLSPGFRVETRIGYVAGSMLQIGAELRARDGSYHRIDSIAPAVRSDLVNLAVSGFKLAWVAKSGYSIELPPLNCTAVLK